MKILYVPLDERPCNAEYPVKAAEVNEEVVVTTLPQTCFGYKKQPADIQRVRQFVKKQFVASDCGVFSAEMLLFGGLLPSRLHHFNEIDLADYKDFLVALHKDYPEKKIYLSNLIMRTPRYDSSDEEPDYYETYGARIFRYGWLKDKQQRESLAKEEKDEWEELVAVLPKEIIQDYEERREFNVKVNLLHIELVQAGVVDFLSIPQDDSAPFGYTAMDQKKVYGAISRKRLKEKIMVYPGADEVGFTLMARAYHEFNNLKPKLFVRYSSTMGPELVPLYEDRPMNESLKAHVMAAGFQLVENVNEADFVLAYNTPGKMMQESWDQLEGKDVTYDSYRHLLTFVAQIKTDLAMERKVGICDSAFANGGELELVQLLDNEGLLEQLLSYKAWNTNCNSLGSSLGALAFCQGNYALAKVKNNLLCNLFEDLFYQAVVRMSINRLVLPGMNLNYFDLKEQQADVIEIAQKMLVDLSGEELLHSFKEPYRITKLLFPWNRMFEINCEVKIGSDEK